jgi:AraC family transcriptional regulator of adaptative response / DNA-3-methyladenine glycosylase II
MLDIAMTAGFGSLRRFNDLFKRRYNLSPTALRKRASEGKKHTSGVTLALGYRPPYHWEKMLQFLAGRAIKGVETVQNSEYMRTAHLTTAEGKPVDGRVRVGHNQKKNALTVTVSETLLPVLPKVLARIRHLFDLYCDPDAVYETLRAMNDLRPGLCVLGTRVPGCFSAFEMAVRAVLGQQITVKAAGTLAARIVDAYGAPVQTGIEGLTHIFPSPETIAALGGGGAVENHFGALGVTAARSRTIYELAVAITRGEIDLEFCARPEEAMKKLMTLRGIGNWTAQYIAMRSMEWPDAFLETDAGVKKALGSYTAKEVSEMAEAWRPWRSYATVNLWNSL